MRLGRPGAAALSTLLRPARPVDDVVELAVEEALAQRADVVVCDDTELDRFGHIGAIERFSTTRRTYQ